MSRYIARNIPKADYSEDRAIQPLGHPQVFVAEPVNTGIVDKNGTPIYRLPDQIGFLPSK